MTTAENRLRDLIRDIPDWPKAGVLFKDITPLLADGVALRSSIDLMAAAFAGETIHVVAAPEARGFIFGASLAVHLGCGFIPVRKQNKLPHETAAHTYDLEYGQDTVEVHRDAVHPGQRVLLVDDVLATGGTMAACARLVESLGGSVVGCAFLLELTFLEGRLRLKDHRVESVLTTE